MPIRIGRIQRDIEAIAAFTATPGEGATRPTFSAEWRAARDYVADQLHACGCEVRIDAAANLHARPAGLSWDEPAWLSGSHVDTVPNGGDFDGVVGVVVPLELLRAAAEEGRGNLPLELAVFAEEEGTTFGLGMLGSRAWAGTTGFLALSIAHNAAGESYLRAGQPHGVRAEDIAAETVQRGRYLGMVEVHIEQGASLWRSGERVAIVDAIAGRRQYRARLQGHANHAGSTSMPDRKDALACAAELILALEALAPELSPRAVATVGEIACRPNAINVIPGEVDLSIDFRDPDNAVLDEGHRRIEALVTETAARRGVISLLDWSEALPAEALDVAICERLQAAAERIGLGPLRRAASGALHDAAILAPYIPTAMLFVASRDGISHNPAELSRFEDIAAAAEVLWELVKE
ncbi:MAG: hydantoinase/carbamoylase family amidase [Gemmatimonadetes bacterium]|nr:hydantoinase/carbamoylase family amidase [Gemmatimonadota bacterium]